MVCHLILTQLEEIWKTTSIFLKIEDDLKFFEGRQPQFFLIKTTLIFLKMEDDLKKIMQPKQFKVKTIIFLKMEDNLNSF